MAEHRLPKPITRVRFPSPAPFFFRLENRMLDAGFSVPHFKERPYSADEKINALDHSELFVLEVVAFIEFK